MQDEPTIGAQFARALARKDFEGLRDLMHPDIDFRGLTPNRHWEASGPDSVVTDVLQEWFEGDEIEGIEHLETDAFADRERVGYRFKVRDSGGLLLVDQQAYLTSSDGRIDWMRVLCAGRRPYDPPA